MQDRAAEFLAEQERARFEARTAAQAARAVAHGGVEQVAWIGVPADDYEAALQAWPDLKDSDLIAGPDGLLPHARYCRELEKRLREAMEAGMNGLRIAPVTVAGFAAWCAEAGKPPGREARAEYAAVLAERRDPELIAWPPGRNLPCWCGSGRKYKKCCAAPPPLPVGRAAAKREAR